MKWFVLRSRHNPLAKVGLDECVFVPGEAAGFARTLEGGDQDEVEVAAAEVAADGGGFLAARLGEGNVGAASVGAGPAPLGFAMADEPQFAHPAMVANPSRGCPARNSPLCW